MNYTRKKAVALKYDHEQQQIPRVAATGKGLIADNIIQKAKDNNIPILEDSSLIEILAELNINEAIPAELYEAVAEVFAFIYRVDKDIEKSKKS